MLLEMFHETFWSIKINMKIHDVPNTSISSKDRISLPDFSVLSRASVWNCTTVGLSLEPSPGREGIFTPPHGAFSPPFYNSKSSWGGPSPQSPQVCICMTELPRNISPGRFYFVVAMCLGKWKEVPVSTKGGAHFKIVLEGARWAPNGALRCLSPIWIFWFNSDAMPTVHLQATSPVTPQSSFSLAFQKPNASSFGQLLRLSAHVHFILKTEPCQLGNDCSTNICWFTFWIFLRFNSESLLVACNLSPRPVK